jgi:hypothetical protein
VLSQLKGQAPDEGGHYITVWAPRQTGKTWIMREVVLTLERETEFDVVILSLQFLAGVTDVDRVVQLIAEKLIKQLNLNLTINTLANFEQLFELRYSHEAIDLDFGRI